MQNVERGYVYLIARVDAEDSLDISGCDQGISDHTICAISKGIGTEELSVGVLGGDPLH